MIHTVRQFIPQCYRFLHGAAYRKPDLSLSSLIAIFIGFILATPCIAQSPVHDSSRHYNNVIRFNLSNHILFGSKNIIFGYERLLSPSQSISINIGHASIPRLISAETDSITISKQSDKTGFNISVDYRFYLQAENKHRAPRGVYIGPYITFNTIRKDVAWQIRRSSGFDQVDARTDFTIFGAGIQLGYQFILFDRVSLDFVMIGPGLANYYLNAKIDVEISQQDRGRVLDALQQAVENRYPGMSIVLEDRQIKTDGVLDTWSGGFRYLVHVGFLF